MTNFRTEGQERFYDLLQRAPRLRHLWKDEPFEMIPQLVERELDVMSPSEVQLTLFFVSVWQGGNNGPFFDNTGLKGFDLVDAMSHLDNDMRSIILDWSADPFWP